MALNFKQPSAGVSPLGQIVVAAAGTPEPLNTNVGPQGQGAQKFATRYKQVTISADVTNTKPIYIVWRDNPAATTPNGILLQIPPGETRSLPDGSLLITSSINLDHLSMDAEVDGEGGFGFVCWG